MVPYPFFGHVNYECSALQAPDAEELNICRAIELLRTVRCVRSLGRRHECLDIVRKEHL